MNKLVLVVLFSIYIFKLGNSQTSKNYNEIKLSIELTDITNVSGIVGDYVSSYFILNGNKNELYYKNETIYYMIKKGDYLKITSVSCDCNEKLVDFGSTVKTISFKDFVNEDTYLYCTKIKLHETHGKYRGQTAIYEHCYNVKVVDKK